MENLELAEKMLARIEDFPQELEMVTWLDAKRGNGEQGPVCNTRACLAGHAMLAAGYSLHWFPVEADTGYDERAVTFIRPNGSHVASEADEARELLGLSDEEFYVDSDDLFHLRSNAEALAKFRGLVRAERARRAASE